jgi:hypothetical protein
MKINLRRATDFFLGVFSVAAYGSDDASAKHFGRVGEEFSSEARQLTSVVVRPARTEPEPEPQDTSPNAPADFQNRPAAQDH